MAENTSKRKNLFKWLYNLLIYGSVGFAIAYIFKTENFSFVGIKDYGYFAGSLVLLVASYYCISLNWYSFLKAYDINVTFRNAFISLGLTVFSKYIPGKVWLIVGRSGFLSKYAPDKVSVLHASSTYIQLLWTYTGGVVGAVFLLFADLGTEWTLLIGIVIAAMTTMVFIPAFQRYSYRILSKLMKRDFNIPVLKAKDLFKVLPQFFLSWIILMIAFDFLLLSMGVQVLNWGIGFSFILAINIGVFAIFLPGGIGLREGLLVGFLTLKGFDKEFALSVSVLGRIWYIIGEAAFFIIAAIWYFSKKKTEKEAVPENV